MTAPLWLRVRTPLVVAVGCGGVGGLAWVSSVSVPLLGVVPLAIVAVVAAALFSSRDEPSRRLERLVKLFRRDR